MTTVSDPASVAGRPAACVMLVDDDAMFLWVLAGNLEDAGYEVLGFDDPHRALDAVRQGIRPDCCVLDWRMPGLDGLALFRQLRAQGVPAPVLFLTSHGQSIFEEAALDAGAADFVDKTRGPAIISQRLSLALTRGAVQADPLDGSPDGPDNPELRVGGLSLALASKRATWRGCPVPLSRNEFDVVLLLAEKAGQDVGYRQIYDVVRGQGFAAGQGDDGYRANVRAMVKRIRRKFERLDQGFAALRNYAGFGYRWYQDE